MNGFFHRLAQRTLRDGELIEPLMPSRYADPRDDGFEEIDAERVVPIAAAPYPFDRAERTQFTDTQAISRPRPGEPETAPTMRVADTGPVQRTVIDPGDDTQPADGRRPARASSPPPAQTRAAHPGPRVKATTEPYDDPPAAVLHSPTRASTPDRPARREHGTKSADPTAMITPARRAAAAEATATVDDRVRQERPPAPPMRTIPTGRHERSGNDRQSPDTRRRSAETAQDTQAAEHVIEVRIGRIEVHAAEQPANVISAGPREPGLSLADYLASRNGGGR